MATFGLPELQSAAPELLENFIQKWIAGEQTRQDRLRSARDTSFGELQSLTQAPQPDLNPMEAGLEQLFGNVASIVSRRPEFQQGASENIGRRRAMLLQARQQNLRLLEQRYQQQAEAVGKIAPEQEIAVREKIQRLHKMMEQDFEAAQLTRKLDADSANVGATNDTRLEEQRLQGEAMRDVARIGADSRIEIAELRAEAAEGQALAKSDFDKIWTDTMQKFSDEKGGIPRQNKPVIKAALLPLTQQGDTREIYERRLAEAFMAIEGRKTLTPEEFQMIRAMSVLKGLPFTPEPAAAKKPAAAKPKSEPLMNRIERLRKQLAESDLLKNLVD